MPGVEKGGTTALFNFMIRHPQVRKKLRFEISGGGSEVLFLGEHWGSSSESIAHKAARYAAMFEPVPKGLKGSGCSAADPLALAGDKTPSYMAFEGAAERLKAVAPDVQLIISLRDPVKRAISSFQYFHGLYTSDLSVHIDDETAVMADFGVAPNNPDMRQFNGFNQELMKRFKPKGRRYHRGAIVGFGLYVVMLRHWMNVFPKHKFKVVFLEEWRGGGDGTAHAVNEMFEWLGLPQRPISSLGDTRSGINSTPQKHKGEVPKDQTCRLIKLYQPYNRALEELLGRKVPKKWLQEC